MTNQEAVAVAQEPKDDFDCKFDSWLKTVCFQKPPEAARELAYLAAKTFAHPTQGAQPASSEGECRPLAWLGLPEGVRQAYDLIYDGATKLDGYVYTPIWRPEDHPCAVRAAQQPKP